MEDDTTPDLDLDEIRRTASRFRKAIEACDRSRLPVSFEEFPRGSCGDVTPLLGTYLLERGFGPFDYVLGEREESECTHAWLRRGQVDVDVTADQFADAPGPIIVCGESSWHRTFRQRVEHVADFRIYDEHTVASLMPAYRLIVVRIELIADLE
jgi:hypothetical protein